MPIPKMPDRELERTVKEAAKGKGPAKTARALGISRTTFGYRMNMAAKRGLLGTDPVLPGFELSKVTTRYGRDGEKIGESVQQRQGDAAPRALPEGFQLNKVSTLKRGDGSVVLEWEKASEGKTDPKVIAEWLKGAFKDVKPTKPKRAPAAAAEELLTLVPCNDWHLGMFAWEAETGTNWDLKIAEGVIGDSVENAIVRSPSSGIGVLLGGGDLLHSDNNRNRTEKSGNVLDVDGRYQKVVEAACRLMVRSVDAMLLHHECVIVRILKGNHDEHSSVAIAYYLFAHYRNEPRVTIDVDPSLFWWFEFGKVLLGSTHGHETKIGQMPGLMAQRKAEAWGRTTWRYVHGFHLHHTAKFVNEAGGVISEIHQAPVPQDAWHFGAGFLSGRSIQAITYHRDLGETGRVRVAILDGGPR